MPKDDEEQKKEQRQAINVPLGDWNLDEVFQLLTLVQRSPVIKVSKDEYIHINEKLVRALDDPVVKTQIRELTAKEEKE